jgi:2-octaprenylphenol hydroxylase
MSDYDSTIIGGGIVGLTFACALADSQLRIAVIDHQIPKAVPLKKDTDLRVSAITPASQKIFDNLHVWSRITKRPMGLFRKMRVWDGETNASIDFDCKTVGAETLGYIIENSVMQAALYEQAKTCDNITFIAPEKLKNYQRIGDEVDVELESGRHIMTRLLVGADGAQSQVRRLMHIDVAHLDYQQSALIATVRCELPHQETARQCFTRGDILAFLPLSDPHICSIVWSLENAEAEKMLKLDSKDFSKLLTTTFRNCLGEVTLQSERAAFPLSRRHAQKYVQANIALVGDAAHTIHPMAGQGVNLGIADAMTLAETILFAQHKQYDSASLTTLRRYERRRKSDNAIMMGALDMIKQLFANQSAPIRTLRGMGLNFTDNIVLVKNYLMRRAMGLT